MVICRLFIEFIIFSCLGWIYECIFCTLQEHSWQNRGFLFGPVCPIYGFCVVGGDLVFRFVEVYYGKTVKELPIWLIFIFSMLVSAIVEYSTSYVLEKRFNILWWDYSHIPLNINGRVSLPTSIGFGVAGAIISRYLLLPINNIINGIPNIVVEILALAGMGLLAADIALTEANLHDLLSGIKNIEEEVNSRVENTYQKLEDGRVKLVENGKQYISSSYQKITLLQKNILNNIKLFRSDKMNGVLDKLKEYMYLERDGKKHKKK